MELGSSFTIASALLGGYLLGSIPFGLVLARIAGEGDLRAIGSGNIGATNVLRTGRRGLAAATLFFDALKGAAAVLLARATAPGAEPFAAAGAMAGHVFPIWLGFRGGKGVATLLGVAAALAWPCGVAFAVVWLLAARLTRISSIGGISGAAATPLTAVALGRPDLALLLAAFAALVVWTHRGNLARLRAGTEPRVGQR